ncbi:MAG: sulfurtransferase complex subunit TusC, partial [Pseudomonadales bacterium]|nr:sulfurtransferase complex subunit TusC [Pseudomonadales bacterium]NIX08881.1 sulfurtransferase complex subunit TusC [Pseudomonadales bacterium]
LYLLRKTPYGSSHAVEALESAFVTGVFDQTVSVLFTDDGVWQLVQDQDGALIGTRTVGKMLKALPEYEITQLFACERSLAERNLSPADLVLRVKVLTPAEQGELLGKQDAVLND